MASIVAQVALAGGAIGLALWVAIDEYRRGVQG